MKLVHSTATAWRTWALVGACALVVSTMLGSGTPAAFGTPRPAREATVTIPTPPKDQAVAALVPANIRKKGAVSVAMDASYPPDEFVAANGTTIIGMDADFNVAIGAVMGIKWNGINATFDTIIAGLQSGKFDVGNSSFTVTSEREKVVHFVTYFKAGEAFYVKSNSTLKLNGLMSLCGKAVSVEIGTTEQTDALNTVKSCKDAHKTPDTVLPYATQSEANLAVSDDRAQLGFADSQVAGYIVEQSHGQFKLDGSAFEVAPYGIAFAKSSGLDVATLAAIKQLMKDGIYKKILDKWGVQAGAINNPAIV